MTDPKNITAIVATLALGAGLVILVWKGDVAHAMTLGALLVPNAGAFTKTETSK